MLHFHVQTQMQKHYGIMYNHLGATEQTNKQTGRRRDEKANIRLACRVCVCVIILCMQNGT